MKLVENIHHSINAIFDIYKVAGNKFYTFSFTYSILSSVFATVLSISVCLIAILILQDYTPRIEDQFYDLLSHPQALQRFMDITLSILLLNLGLYGAFLIRELKGGLQDKYNFKTFWSSVSISEWKQYFIFLFVILLYHTILFKFLFTTNPYYTGIFDVLDPYYYHNNLYQFYSWLNEIVEFIKKFLPLLMAMVMVMINGGERFSITSLRKYKIAFLSALILFICIDAISRTTIDYINIFIIDLVRVPAINYIFPAIFSITIVIVVVSIFYLGFAGVVSIPIKIENERKTLAKND